MADVVLEGRETATPFRVLCVVLTLLAAGAGVFAIGGSEHSSLAFAWETAAPVNLLLLGSLFIGAVPLMVGGALQMLWENARIAVLPGLVLVAALLLGTLRNAGDTFLGGGDIVAFAFSWIWTLALAGVVLGCLAAIPAQAMEPGLPLARQVPLPGWSVPAVALQGSGWLGLGLAFLLRPELGEHWIPWPVAPLDIAALGAGCLTLGWAVLQALTENDLARVRPGLTTLLVVGMLGLASLSHAKDQVDWSSWTGPIPVLLLVGLGATGLLGHLILRRATPAAAGAREPVG